MSEIFSSEETVRMDALLVLTFLLGAYWSWMFFIGTFDTISAYR